MTSTPEILGEVLRERFRQDKKWGPQDHSPEKWLAILGEEVGEACRVTLDYEDLHLSFTNGHAKFREELIQVAAVAVSIIEWLDNGVARVSVAA